MRIFWSLIGVLVLVTGAMLWMRGDRSEPGAARPTSGPEIAARGAADVPDRRSGADRAPEAAMGEAMAGGGADEPEPGTLMPRTPDEDPAPREPGGVIDSEGRVSEPAPPGGDAGGTSAPGHRGAEDGPGEVDAEPVEILADAGESESREEPSDDAESRVEARAESDEAAKDETEVARREDDASASEQAAAPAEPDDAGEGAVEVAAEDAAGDEESAASMAPAARASDAEAEAPADASLEEGDVVLAEAGSPGGRLVRRADGSLLIGEDTVVHGEGTAEAPYEITWDLLTSAQRVYNPRRGQTELPAWAEHLDGKHVRIRGHMMLPVVATHTDELLLMLNEWDGCCLGVPPTPYDAIEVKLGEPIDGSMGNVAYGAVKGVFEMDPYLSGQWLLGLYVMHDAEVEGGTGGRRGR